MALIFETVNFIVEAVDEPLVTRSDGGHISITPKIAVVDRTGLSPKLAIELMRLTMITGEAMATALIAQGINIGRINYQDNGNWGVFKPGGPQLHIHLYGRSKDATIQKYGEACSFPFRETGFYEGFEPLNVEDINAVRNEIEIISTREKYQPGNW